MKSTVHVSQLKVLIAAFLTAAVVAVGLSVSAQAQALPQADRDFIDATIKQAMKEDKQPGISISVSSPKGDYAKGYGVRDRIWKTPLGANDHFRIGSISKVFTAHAVLIQVDKGTVKLEDTVDKYVAGIPNGNIITVRDLLAMRSGLYDYTADTLYQVSLALNPRMLFSPQNAVNIMKRNATAFAPGTQYAYSNSNYILLGLILEKVTGKKVEKVIADDVTKPLGLANTSFPTTTAMPAPHSRGYGPNPLISFLTMDYTAVNPAVAWTAGAMVSTNSDLVKYAKAVNEGALLSPATQAERLQFCSITSSASHYGYGLGILSYGQWQGHNGSIPGFGSVMFFDPASGTVITGMENAWRNNFLIFTRIMPQIAERLYPGSLTSQSAPGC